VHVDVDVGEDVYVYEYFVCNYVYVFAQSYEYTCILGYIDY